MNKPQVKLYSDAMTGGLDEYVKQEISGFANRYYDVGKFLFTVSTFAILAIFTLRTTFGENYNLILTSIVFFSYCLYPSYKLTVGIDYEIDPENTILKEYENKKKWMKKHLKRWVTSFIIGVIILAVFFGFSMLKSPTQPTKIEDELRKINSNLIETLGALREITKKYDWTETSCNFNTIEAELLKLQENIKNNSENTMSEFNKNNVHNDRHLNIITAKITSACASPKN